MKPRPTSATADRATQNAALGRLHDLAVFVRAEEDLRAHLDELVALAASATGAATCSIMLLAESERESPRLKLWASTGDLPLPVWSETIGESIATRVLDRGEPVLVPDIRASELAPLARQRRDLGSSFISSPITIGSNAIGVMNLSSRVDAPPFDESDLRVAEIVATLIGKCVQVERLQTLIRSRVAHTSLAQEEKQAVARLTDGTVPPARIAKLLAKSFFRDLSSAGFEPAQIIEAASEIIALVSGDITRFRKRIERKP